MRLALETAAVYYRSRTIWKGYAVMSDAKLPITGGCLCGALRYEVSEAPGMMGNCYCGDCRKASGSGFIPFAMFSAASLKVTGPILAHGSPSASGRVAVRNSCATCGGLVFGGPLGETQAHTIYVGSADDPSWFEPKIAIFARDVPAWVEIPEDLVRFDGLPG